MKNYPPKKMERGGKGREMGSGEEKTRGKKCDEYPLPPETPGRV